jgi:hypothetical protein
VAFEITEYPPSIGVIVAVKLINPRLIGLYLQVAVPTSALVEMLVQPGIGLAFAKKATLLGIDTLAISGYEV